MKIHHSAAHLLFFLIAAVLLLLLCACNTYDNQIPELATGQALQATQIAGLETRISNADQIDQLSTLQAQQANQIAAQATRLSDTGQIDQLSTVQAQQAAQIANQDTWISYLFTRTPPQIVLPENPTVTPYLPVEGSVTIEDGHCCAGGVAGETIDVSVAFEAFSPLAEVTEMRLLSGGLQFEESDMAAADWEPFVTSKRLPVRVFINWSGYHVSVQYRDVDDNLSRVFHDDISIEGHPPPPTP